MRFSKSAMNAWVVGVSVAALIGLGGPAWAESMTKPPPTRPPAQQPAKGGQPKDFMIDFKWEATKGDSKPSAVPKATK